MDFRGRAAFHDVEHALRVSFMASYRDLEPRQALFLRQLALIPGEFKTDDGYITSEVAATASGLSCDNAQRVTEALQSLDLIRRCRENEYTLHDDLNVILLDLAETGGQEEKDAVTGRLKAWQRNDKDEGSR
jgi:hypothetical protein